jgi:hypothetical protein
VLEATSSSAFKKKNVLFYGNKKFPAAKLKSVTKKKLILFKQFSDTQLATVTFELSNPTLLKLLSSIEYMKPIHMCIILA